MILFLSHRRISGIQQLNEWTDLLSHIEQHSSPLDNNSFELKTHITDELMSNMDMTQVYII